MAKLDISLPHGWSGQPVDGYPHITALTRLAGGVVSIDRESGAFAAGVCIPGRHSPRVVDYDGSITLTQLVCAATQWLDKVMPCSRDRSPAY